jgi:CheY-like chemotaxis protein
MSTLPLALLIDRDPDTRRMYREYLRLAQWAAEEAGDGREALAKAIALRPDVIVTETRLPGMSGYDLCAILRCDVATRATPIVVVTADAFEPDIERARMSGADTVLTKPCLPETLLIAMRRLRPAAAADASKTAAAAGQRILSHTHERRDTTSPPIPPPPLVCPRCERPLMYRRSHVGGVSARYPEQWDYFECPNKCGTFQYRERTRTLRRVS